MGCGVGNEKASSDVNKGSGENQVETGSDGKVGNDDKKPAEGQKEESEKEDKGEEKSLSKEEYVKKLNDAEKTIVDLDKKMEAATTQADMNQIQDEIFQVWDGVLNEIYGALKKQLPEAKMSKLKDEQGKWITHRDEVAKEESSEYEGGTMETLQYLITQTRLTKERSYELVNNYMK